MLQSAFYVRRSAAQSSQKFSQSQYIGINYVRVRVYVSVCVSVCIQLGLAAPVRRLYCFDTFT